MRLWGWEGDMEERKGEAKFKRHSQKEQKKKNLSLLLEL